MANSFSVFAQFLQHLHRFEFQNIVDRYDGDKKTRRLPMWSQFLALLFGQLTGHNSLRAIVASFKSAKTKLYHLGIPFEICRSTLSDANDKRPVKIFEEAFYHLLPKVQRLAPQYQLKLKSKILILDSTTIELCLTLSPWALFHHKKGACKLHVALDVAGNLPTVLVLTDGRSHDLKVAKSLSFLAGTVLLIDRAYVDTAWLWELTQQGVFFVTRLKKNLHYKVRECRKTDRTQGLLADQTIRLTGPQGKQYEGRLRKVCYRDPETGRKYIFLTNRFDLAAKTICDLYKARWQVELFFKVLKQHLQVKKFLGTSANAVLAQVWVAFIAYLLVLLVKFRSRLGWPLSSIMAVLTSHLFYNKALDSLWGHVPKERCRKQALAQMELFQF